MPKNENPRELKTLLAIMKALRDPEHGCPWDVQQTFKSITPYTIEEAYEVVDAVERDDMDDLCDELGDLLLQVVFYAQIASEKNSFGIDDVVEAISTKMIRRHPHVFGSAKERGKIPEKGFWENIKAGEKAGKEAGKGDDQAISLLDSVPVTLPALSRANKLQSKAARVGFDWPDISGVYHKVDEEMAELKQATSDEERGEELGDLMFTMVNLARHMDFDPEQVLREANFKFQRRFNQMEETANCSLADCSADELEQLWQQAKLKAPAP